MSNASKKPVIHESHIRKETQSKVLSTEEAANYLGTTHRFLEQGRLKGYPAAPRFIKLSHKQVGYLQEDLDAWLTIKRRNSTTDPGVDLEKG